MRWSSSESQISAWPSCEKSPLVLKLGCNTMVAKRPAGTLIVSLRITLITTGFAFGSKYLSNEYSFPTSSGSERTKKKNEASSSGSATASRREDVVLSQPVPPALVEILFEAQRVERLDVHPAVVRIVDVVRAERRASLDVEVQPPGGAAAHGVDPHDLHDAVAAADSGEPDVVLETLSGAPRHPCMRLGRQRCGREREQQARERRDASREEAAQATARGEGLERAAHPRLARSITSGHGLTRLSRGRRSHRDSSGTLSVRRASRTAVRRSSTLVAHTGGGAHGRAPCSFSRSRTILILRSRNPPNGSFTPGTVTNERMGHSRGSHRASRASFRTGSGADSPITRSTATTSAPPSKRFTSSGRCSGWSVKSACISTTASRRGYFVRSLAVLSSASTARE